MQQVAETQVLVFRSVTRCWRERASLRSSIVLSLLFPHDMCPDTHRRGTPLPRLPDESRYQSIGRIPRDCVDFPVVFRFPHLGSLH